MARIGAGAGIDSLRQEVGRLRAELDGLGEPADLPELVESANLLRANDLMARAAAKREELLGAYARYCEALESTLLGVFEIQSDLKEILEAQSRLLGRRSGRPGAPRRGARGA